MLFVTAMLPVLTGCVISDEDNYPHQNSTICAMSSVIYKGVWSVSGEDADTASLRYFGDLHFSHLPEKAIAERMLPNEKIVSVKREHPFSFLLEQIGFSAETVYFQMKSMFGLEEKRDSFDVVTKDRNYLFVIGVEPKLSTLVYDKKNENIVCNLRVASILINGEKPMADPRLLLTFTSKKRIN